MPFKERTPEQWALQDKAREERYEKLGVPLIRRSEYKTKEQIEKEKKEGEEA